MLAMRTCTTSSVQPARGSGTSRKLLAIKVLHLIEHRSKALILREHMCSSHHSHPLRLSQLLSLWGLWIRTMVCVHNLQIDSIISSDLRSWHSGPSDKHEAQQVAAKSNNAKRDTR